VAIDHITGNMTRYLLVERLRVIQPFLLCKPAREQTTRLALDSLRRVLAGPRASFLLPPSSDYTLPRLARLTSFLSLPGITSCTLTCIRQMQFIHISLDHPLLPYTFSGKVSCPAGKTIRQSPSHGPDDSFASRRPTLSYSF
jgi:hypothetical protein